ncbi:cupin domain-containing protein [Glacieibacterium sp.]|uniref:cupin domain-containing protein n=1 Tax=Glacieibacterium sp. TaxID=2860237 RepID=UPI003B005FE3
MPSFVDLRAFAADAAAGVPTTETGDRYLSARRLLPVPEGVVAVAVLTLDGGTGRVEALAADEFVIVLAGALTVDGTKAAVDDSIVVPAGLTFDWSAAPGTTAIVVRCDSGAPGSSKVVRIDKVATLVSSNPPSAALLIGDTPSCRNHTDYLSASGEFMAGVWDSTPYHRAAMDYPHYELMHLLEGSVTFEDAVDGRRATFSKGDVFVVVQGTRASWLSEENCAKVYAIYRPKVATA